MGNEKKNSKISFNNGASKIAVLVSIYYYLFWSIFATIKLIDGLHHAEERNPEKNMIFN